MATDASWRCWAMESATSLSASSLDSLDVRTDVVRGGISLRGFDVRDRSVSSADVMVARLYGRRGGSDKEEEGWRCGVDQGELEFDSGRTRFSRRKEKNAA